MHHYQIYGLHLASEVALGGLDPFLETQLPIDLFISFGPVDPVLGGERGEPQVLASQPGRITLDLEGLGRFLVTHLEVRVDPAPGASLERVLTCLLGQVLGFVVHQRGYFSLQASAVETLEGAVLFVGLPGAGKSTIAAHFRRRGYRILADDLAVLAQDGRGGFRVLPGIPELRLCPDAHQRLGGQDGIGQGDKVVVPLGRTFCPLPTPLRAICFLKSHRYQGTVLQPVAGFDRIGWLLAHTHHPALMACGGPGCSGLVLAGHLARTAECLQVLRDMDPGGIEAGVTLLEAALAGPEAPLEPVAQAGEHVR